MGGGEWGGGGWRVEDGRVEKVLRISQLKCHIGKHMKSFGAGLLVLAATALVADARLINSRNFRELDKQSDIIVVARPVSSKDTAEQIDLPRISPAIPVVGMSSEFEVSLILKGDNSLKKVVVHHYRLASERPLLMIGAPNFASFDPKASTRYFLFLQREPDGRYAPF